jgi:hypothetical protein
MNEFDLSFYIGVVIGCLCVLVGVWVGRRTS